jgi:hypothetical protein
MKVENAREGMYVRIKPDISRTDARYSSCDEMHNMCNKVYQIGSISTDMDSISCAHIGGYTWHLLDLEEVKIDIPEKIVHFDIKELVI